MRRPVGEWIGQSLVLLACLLCHVEARAGSRSTGPEAVVGQWDIFLDNSSRRCRLTLRADPSSSGGQAIGIPAGCRKALPVLATIEGWSLSDDHQLDLTDRNGAPVLEFAAGTGKTFTASGPRGETYRLVAAPSDGPAAVSPAAATQGSSPARSVARTEPTAPTLRPSDVAGHYAILREGGKDTGCMLTLDDKIKGQGGDKATLAPACRDQGIVIFDPVGWRLVNGRLQLTARRGHSTHLDRQPDGTWLKDPSEGKSLSLKKL